MTITAPDALTLTAASITQHGVTTHVWLCERCRANQIVVMIFPDEPPPSEALLNDRICRCCRQKDEAA